MDRQYVPLETNFDVSLTNINRFELRDLKLSHVTFFGAT